MEANKFLKDFVEIFDDKPTETITMNTVFRDIEGWSSMAALGLMAMVDIEYKIIPALFIRELTNSRYHYKDENNKLRHNFIYSCIVIDYGDPRHFKCLLSPGQSHYLCVPGDLGPTNKRPMGSEIPIGALNYKFNSLIFRDYFVQNQ